MFDIISRNMREIAPTGNTLEEDRISWTRAMQEELQNPDKHWVLAFDGEALVGYVLYRIENHSALRAPLPGGECILHMDEIQIEKAYQGDGETFPLLMGKMLYDAKEAGARTVHTHVNKQNAKSQGIVRAMGLRIVKEKPCGFIYEGKAKDAYTRFGKNIIYEVYGALE